LFETNLLQRVCNVCTEVEIAGDIDKNNSHYKTCNWCKRVIELCPDLPPSYTQNFIEAIRTLKGQKGTKIYVEDHICVQNLQEKVNEGKSLFISKDEE